METPSTPNPATEQEQEKKPAAEAPLVSPTPLDLAALESMLAEAEQRGYDRARAEIATSQWNTPTVGQQPAPAPAEVKEEPFLLHRRRSIWD